MQVGGGKLAGLAYDGTMLGFRQRKDRACTGLGPGLALLALLAVGQAAPAPADPRPVAYVGPILRPAAFNLDVLGMIDAERKQHAANLAAFGLATVLPHAGPDGRLAGVPAEQYRLARKLVGLALHLDPRCKTAVVVNGRLKAGVVAKTAAEPSISAAAYSTLLVGRSEELVKAGGADNLRLAGCFLDLATALDKENDNAVYALEMFRMEGHAVDWKPILGAE